MGAQDLYEIETNIFLHHGMRLYQAAMLAEDEDDHIKACLALAGYRRADAVCDMGCGIGYQVAAMHRCGIDAVGVTNCKKQVEIARAEYDAPVFFADMIATPFPADRFDAVQWMESIGYAGHDAAFSEAHRILKPGGVAIVKDFNAHFDADNVSASWKYAFVPAEQMIDAAHRCGFLFHRGFALIQASLARFRDLYSRSEELRRLHPWPHRAACIPFWYEFVKLKGE